MTDEIVALYDDTGTPVGTALRSRMRAENLRHGATSILVINSHNEILVHRRTVTKDLYPGRYDFAAGGVIKAGECPLDSALRELAEEVGIDHVELKPLGHRHYRDDNVDYVAFCYETRWDGPVTAQPEEVSDLAWVPVAEVLRRIDDPSWSFMPDSVTTLNWRLRQLLEEHCDRT